MKKIFIAYCLLFASNSFAFDSFTKEDIALQSTFTIITIVDYGQTLNIAKHPNTWKETNLILGEHPKEKAVNIYFPVAIGAHAVVSYLIPNSCQIFSIKCRTIWQYSSIAVELKPVISNFAIGINSTF